MNICDACGYHYKEHRLDDLLHLTNWNLPNKQTAEVCSVECQRIIVMQYELQQLIYAQKERSRTRKMSEAIDRVKGLLHETSFTTISDQEIRNLYYKLRSTIDLDEDD